MFIGAPLFLVPAGAAFAATLTVNSTADTDARDAVLTLREALLYTNNTRSFGDFDATEQLQIDESTSLSRDTIAFNIGGGGTAQTIAIGSSLPLVAAPVYIDGTTQLGAAATTPGIVIDGNNSVATGFEVSGTGGGSELRGLVVGRFTDRGIYLNNTTGNVIAGNHLGVDLAGTSAFANGDGGSVTDTGVRVNGGTSNTIGGTTAADRNIISGNNPTGIFITQSAQGVRVIGNLIGTDVTGSVALPNQGEGMRLDASPTNNTVGGSTPEERNIISGNGTDGIIIRGDENTISGNYIGTDVTGLVALPNGTNGIHLGERTSDGNTIGGVNATAGALSAGNLISGNAQSGIRIQGLGSPSNVVSGNFIGTDATGTQALPNGIGVSIVDDPDDTYQAGALNLIGGINSTPGSLDVGNLISGNTGPGVRLGALTQANTIRGNFIGTQIDGTSALPNGTAGIELQASSDQNAIGSPTAGAGNVIAFNDGPGILLTGAGTERNDIQGNAIHDNNGLGIDLGGDGVTANDAGDVDTNPNQLQNFPLLVSGGTAVVGSLDSSANTTFRIDAYANAAVDSSGNGEGEVFLGSGVVTTDGTGHVDFELPVASGLIPGKPWISVTATDPGGNTSEFSVPQDCSVVPAPAFAITSQTDDTAAGTVSDTCEGVAGLVLEAGSSSNVSFNLVSGSPNEPYWSFEVSLQSPFAPGTAVLTATDANGSPSEQTINLPGVCDGSVPPVFDITAQTATSASGTVTDNCDGVYALTLDPASSNVTLDNVVGNPGDAVWTFEINQVNTYSTATAVLNSDDSFANTAQETVNLPGVCDGSVPPVFDVTGQTGDSASGTVTDNCDGISSVTLDPSSSNVTLDSVVGNPGEAAWTFEVNLVDRYSPGTAVLNGSDSFANSTQRTIDLTGVCDPSVPPTFNITEQTETTATGTVEDDCNGIVSLVLGPDSENTTLTITAGAPGDSIWTFEIALEDSEQAGSAQLIANDGAAVSADSTLSITGTGIIAVPLLGPLGVAIVAVLLMMLGVRRRTIVQ